MDKDVRSLLLTPLICFVLSLPGSNLKKDKKETKKKKVQVNVCLEFWDWKKGGVREKDLYMMMIYS